MEALKSYKQYINTYLHVDNVDVIVATVVYTVDVVVVSQNRRIGENCSSKRGTVPTLWSELTEFNSVEG